MYNATDSDKTAALSLLSQKLGIYKRDQSYTHKANAIQSFVNLLALLEPRTYDRKTEAGMRRRHEIRDELHALSHDEFLRRLSELLHKEG